MMSDIADLLFHDKTWKRDKWMQIFEDPVWKPIYNVPLEAHRQLAYSQLKKVMNSGVVSVLNFFDDPTNIFTAHQMIGSVTGHTATKFTVHMNLFGGTITALHTQRHRWIFQKLDKLEITGCFCLTQLGYGNNAVQMQTTSTYDEKAKQFIINSPTTLSQKYWITNGAVHADYALVFAQTIVKGKNQGVNAFLVPVRDKNKKQMNGVQISDMGVKIGLNGVDNATLKFHQVRIPREYMMNKYADVSEEGQFKCDVKGIQSRFFKVTERLLSGRLCIAAMTIGAMKTAIYIAVRFAQQRKGVSPNGKSETPIIDYQLQKNALIPIIARTLGINMLHNYAKQAFENSKDHKDDLIMICCVDKVLVGWNSERGLAVLRQRCGGQGFLAANMFGDAIVGAHAAMTAQGDNRVLMVKVVKDMLTILKKDPDFFYSGQFIKITKKEQLEDMKLLVQVFHMRQKYLLDSLVARMMVLKGKGLSNYDILMKNVSDEIQDLAQAYGEKLAIIKAEQSLKKLSPKSQGIMLNYFQVFAWEIILKDLSTFLLQKWICPDLAQQLKLIYNDKIKQAANDIEIIVNSLNVPKHAIYAPIANDYVKYNQQPYYGQVVNAKM